MVSLIQTLFSEVFSFQRLLSIIYTNVAFGTDESVLFIDVSLTQELS